MTTANAIIFRPEHTASAGRPGPDDTAWFVVTQGQQIVYAYHRAYYPTPVDVVDDLLPEDGGGEAIAELLERDDSGGFAVWNGPRLVAAHLGSGDVHFGLAANQDPAEILPGWPSRDEPAGAANTRTTATS